MALGNQLGRIRSDPQDLEVINDQKLSIHQECEKVKETATICLLQQYL
jgi:hypothetical protein